MADERWWSGGAAGVAAVNDNPGCRPVAVPAAAAVLFADGGASCVAAR